MGEEAVGNGDISGHPDGGKYMLQTVTDSPKEILAATAYRFVSRSIGLGKILK